MYFFSRWKMPPSAPPIGWLFCCIFLFYCVNLANNENVAVNEFKKANINVKIENGKCVDSKIELKINAEGECEEGLIICIPNGLSPKGMKNLMGKAEKRFQIGIGMGGKKENYCEKCKECEQGNIFWMKLNGKSNEIKAEFQFAPGKLINLEKNGDGLKLKNIEKDALYLGVNNGAHLEDYAPKLNKSELWALGINLLGIGKENIYWAKEGKCGWSLEGNGSIDGSNGQSTKGKMETTKSVSKIDSGPSGKSAGTKMDTTEESTTPTTTIPTTTTTTTPTTTTTTEPPIREWSFDDGLTKDNNGGILIIGEIGQDAKEISIKLSQKKEGVYVGILQLDIGIEEKYYKLSDGTDNGSKMNVKEKPNYKGGSLFEAFIQINGYGKYDIWMDNVQIQYQNPEKLSTVHFAEIIGDKVKATNMIRTPKIPYECKKFDMSYKNKAHFILVGKLFPPGIGIEPRRRQLNIDLFNKGTHIVPLEINAAYGISDRGHNRNVSIIQYIESKPKIIGSELESKHPEVIKLGVIFHLDIYYKSTSEMAISFNGTEEVFKSVNVFDDVKGYKISSDVVVLSDKNCVEE